MIHESEPVDLEGRSNIEGHTPAEAPVLFILTRLAGFAYLEHGGPTGPALPTGGRTAILHRYLLGLFDLSRLATLHAVSSH